MKTGSFPRLKKRPRGAAGAHGGLCVDLARPVLLAASASGPGLPASWGDGRPEAVLPPPRCEDQARCPGWHCGLQS